jgi:predicted nucleic acid binding AN1-type Zn finger protein
MSEQDSQKIPKRCMMENCKCKLKLTDYPCRCGKYFCGEHRLSEYHKCTFDYKALNKEFLLKTMSTPVIAEKVAVI